MQCTSVHSISRQSTGWQYVRRQNTGGLTTYWQPTDWQIITGKVPACILSAGKVHHVQNTSRQYIGRQSTSWQYMGRQSSTCATWLACKLPTTDPDLYSNKFLIILLVLSTSFIIFITDSPVICFLIILVNMFKTIHNWTETVQWSIFFFDADYSMHKFPLLFFVPTTKKDKNGKTVQYVMRVSG